MGTRRRKLQQFAAAGAVALCLAPGASALAHTLPSSVGAKYAKKAAVQAMHESGAASYRLSKCHEPTKHRYVCDLQLKFRSSRHCTAQVIVMYASPTSTRIRYGTTNTVCY
jgi:hypothetical protein